MPTRTIYLSDDLDGAVRAVAEAMDGDENRSTVIQEADPAVEAIDAMSSETLNPIRAWTFTATHAAEEAGHV